MKNKKIIRTASVSESLSILLNGQLHFLNEHFEVIAVSSDGDDLKIVSKREGVETKAIEIKRKISPLNDLISLFELCCLFRKERPLIVHSITPKAGLLSMIAAKIVGIPIRIHTFTGLVFPYRTGFLQKLLIQTDRLICLCATNIYPEGEGVKNDLVSFKITKKPLKVLANGNVNGIDLEYFDPKLYSIEEKENLRQELGINENDFVSIFVGRLVKDKGINELVEAFNNISKKQSNIKLLLVGSAEPDLDPLKAETEKIIIQNKDIIAVGFKPDVRPYFSIANLLAFPSYREGFPNVVLQAGAMELPCIVNNISGCNEIIIDGVNGVITSKKNTEALEESMYRLLTDHTLYEQMKINAREIISSRYQQQIIWAAILNEYKHLETSI